MGAVIAVLYPADANYNNDNDDNINYIYDDDNDDNTNYVVTEDEEDQKKGETTESGYITG